MTEKAKALTVNAVIKLIRLVAGRIVSNKDASTQEKKVAKDVLAQVKHFRG